VSVSPKMAHAVNFLLYGMTGSTGAFYNLVSVLNSTYSCTHANYGEGGTYMGSGTYGTRSAYNPGCKANHTSDSASSVITSSKTLKAATSQTLGLISARIQGVKLAAKADTSPVTVALSKDLRRGALGISSGDELEGVGIWAQGAYTWMEDENTDTLWEGTVNSFMVGVDTTIDKAVLIGISGGYEETSLDTTFNKGNLDASGYSVAPYASLLLDDVFSVDATGGIAWLSYDVDRIDTTSTKITGTFDSERWFAAVKANANFVPEDDVNVNLHLGYSYTQETQDKYTEVGGAGTPVVVAENDVELGQGLVGGRISYNGGIVRPFFSAQGEWDLSKDEVAVASNQTKPEDADFGVRLGVGAQFVFSPQAMLRLEGQTVLNRENFQESKVIGKARIEF